ncbi:MAG TPA: tripartite tricarboxylate transporter substrate binding protein [Burkholderiales bacterium]|nr:tripartite tricarboxylate transporter substrate binding protein [Burkholderiales bacterium]
MIRTSIALSVVAAALIATPALGQSYPVKNVRLINAFAPGGASDVVARAFAQKLTEYLGQQVTVENRVGAGGNIASEYVARSAPDGYTILMGTLFLATNESLYSKLTWNAQKDFAPISMVTASPLILCVHPSLPVKSTKELIALAKQRPGDLNFPSAGNGTSMHLSGELFNMMAGIKTQHVPYKGSAPGVLDLVSGRIHFMLNPMPEPMPFIKAGKLRALATSTAKRIQALPDLPPVAEAIPGYETITWQGPVAPAGTPKPVIDRLHAEFTRALKDAEFAARMRGLGLELYGTTPAEFAQMIRDESAKWGKVIRATGAKLD